MAELDIRRVGVRIGPQTVLSQVSLRVVPGQLVIVLGANGAGKTTLMRAALGLVRTDEGSVRLDGYDPRTLRPNVRARRAAYLPQARPLAWPLRVRDVVALGRYGYGAGTGRLDRQDQEAVDQALADCDLMCLADRAAPSLSGGEQARMHVARALATRAPLLLADEPVAALDPLQAWRVMDLIRRFVSRGGAALVVLHDVNLAAQHATDLVVLSEGRVLADGPPGQVLTPNLLARTYGIEAVIHQTDAGPSIIVRGPA